MSEEQAENVVKKGSCFKSCLMGCGTVLAVNVLLAVIVVTWFSIPYGSQPTEAFFSSDYSAIAELKIDPSNPTVFKILEQCLRFLSQKRHRFRSEEAREKAVGQDMMRVQKLREMSPFIGRLFIVSHAMGERYLLLVAIPQYSKIFQTIYNLMFSTGLNRMMTTKVCSATVLSFNPSEDVTPLVFAIYKGHIMIGTSISAVYAAVCGLDHGKPQPKSKAFETLWPVSSSSVIKGALSNSKGTLSRYVLDQEIAREIQRREENNKDLEKDAKKQSLSYDDVKRDITDGKVKFDMDYSVFEGLSIEAELESIDSIKATIDFHLKDALPEDKFLKKVQMLKDAVAVIDGLKVELDEVSGLKNGYRLPVKITGIQTVMDYIQKKMDEEAKKSKQR